MPGVGCRKKGSVAKTGRVHTPIVSKKQRGFMGAEIRRRRLGMPGRIESMSEAQLAAHLHESAGKKLPMRSRTRGARRARAKKGRKS